MRLHRPLKGKRYPNNARKLWLWSWKLLLWNVAKNEILSEPLQFNKFHVLLQQLSDMLRQFSEIGISFEKHISAGLSDWVVRGVANHLLDDIQLRADSPVINLVWKSPLPRLAKSRSIWVLTGPVVKTGFNRSFLVDWWSIGGQLGWLNH